MNEVASAVNQHYKETQYDLDRQDGVFEALKLRYVDLRRMVEGLVQRIILQAEVVQKFEQYLN